MKYFFSITFFVVLFFASNHLAAQIKRIDTTMMIGNSGYRIKCSNKDLERNELDIKPIGFDKEAHESAMYLRGIIVKSQIDDLNNDGFPDLVICTISGPKGEFGNAYAVVSMSNKAFVAVGLPDVQLNAKYKDGYRGHDEFSLLEGTLMRKFPVYKPDDKDNAATGGKRIIQYQLTGSEDTGFKFTVQQSYDLK
jgi:hypothetical protein